MATQSLGLAKLVVKSVMTAAEHFLSLLDDVVLTGLFFVLFNFVVPPVVHVITKNSWSKVGAMILLSVPSAAIMAWLHYFPLLLFPIWMIATYHMLQVMGEKNFETDHRANMGMAINLRVYKIAGYCYVIITCALAALVEVRIVSAKGDLPLWRYFIQ